MLTVTESAKQHLKELLLAHTDDPGIGLRLTGGGGVQFGLKIDSETPGDDVVEHEGLRVLLVGPEVAPVVAGATLDTRDTPEGTKLVIYRE